MNIIDTQNCLQIEANLGEKPLTIIGRDRVVKMRKFEVDH